MNSVTETQQLNTTKKSATHLEHLLGASVDDALASLLHLVKETHDDECFILPWNDTIEDVVCNVRRQATERGCFVFVYRDRSAGAAHSHNKVARPSLVASNPWDIFFRDSDSTVILTRPSSAEMHKWLNKCEMTARLTFACRP
jgi:hypothetical protein